MYLGLLNSLMWKERAVYPENAIHNHGDSA